MIRKTATVNRTIPVAMAMMLFAVTGAFAQPRVLATTAWTAAFATAAGAQQVELLAPYEMRHPPEYELRATDLRRVERADLVVYAGYETMMERLRRAVGESNVTAVQITTTHNAATIEASVMKIAEALGTEAVARENLAAINRFLDEWRNEIRTQGLHERPVIGHAMQAALLGELGVHLVGRFGPAPLEAQQIAGLSRSGAELIIDNWHNEVTGPLRETLSAIPVASFINFPGPEGTRTLLDVLRYNRDLLRAVLR